MRQNSFDPRKAEKRASTSIALTETEHALLKEFGDLQEFIKEFRVGPSHLARLLVLESLERLQRMTERERFIYILLLSKRFPSRKHEPPPPPWGHMPITLGAWLASDEGLREARDEVLGLPPHTEAYEEFIKDFLKRFVGV